MKIGYDCCHQNLEVISPFTDAGFDRVVLMNADPDHNGFLTSTLRPRLLSVSSR